MLHSNGTKLKKNIDDYLKSIDYSDEIIKILNLDNDNIDIISNNLVFNESHLSFAIYKNRINQMKYIYQKLDIIKEDTSLLKRINYNSKYEVFLLECINHNFKEGFIFLFLQGHIISDKCILNSFNFNRYDIAKYILDNIDIDSRKSYNNFSFDYIINCNNFCVYSKNPGKSIKEFEPVKCNDTCIKNSKENLFRLAYYTDKHYNSEYKYLDLVKQYYTVYEEYTLIYNIDIKCMEYCRKNFNYDYSKETFCIIFSYYRENKNGKRFKKDEMDNLINYIYKTDINNKIGWNSKLLNWSVRNNCSELVYFLINELKIDFDINEFDFKDCDVEIPLLLFSKTSASKSPLLTSSTNKKILNFNINGLLRHINLDEPGFRQLIYEDTSNMHPILKNRCIKKLHKLFIRDNQIVELLKHDIPIAEDLIRYEICKFL